MIRKMYKNHWSLCESNNEEAGENTGWDLSVEKDGIQCLSLSTCYFAN